MPRTATIGPEIFERVNALVAEGKSRTEAFAQVGQERSSRPGTVAANYYRVARAQGQTSGRRRANGSRATGTRAGRGRAAASAPTARRRSRGTAAATSDGGGDIRQIAQQIAELTQQLVRQVEARDKQLRDLLG
jgi:hypothetical protein